MNVVDYYSYGIVFLTIFVPYCFAQHIDSIG